MKDLYQAWRDAPQDRELFHHWCVKAYPALLLIALRMTKGIKTDSEELVQAILLEYLEKNYVKKLSTEEEATRYLYTMIRHRWISMLRQRDRWDLDSPRAETFSDANAPDRILSYEQRYREIESSLSESDMAILESVIEGRKITEIAKQNSISYSTAAVRVHRIREKIRTLK